MPDKELHRDVRILITGGTLDKVHDARTEGLGFPSDGTSHIPEMLAVGRCHFPITQRVLQKDSLEFTDQDRSMILEAARSAAEEALVITHGTGTMGQTARFLDGKLPDKTVVLTGAMRPFSLSSSDGEFNLGAAITAAQILPAGVYGAMNGRMFAAAQLNKNIETGRFDT
ncbi:MAG: asparaginase domain-containing protein [Pseudomonadota bacterium]